MIITSQIILKNEESIIKKNSQGRLGLSSDTSLHLRFSCRRFMLACSMNKGLLRSNETKKPQAGSQQLLFLEDAGHHD